ncbi:hypothetical protein C8Q74DRAFT_1214337 [Fomes fomentarius]|nr:hypothetical protein C8Q74DRAFT_1214337 [Fomes fomentarius]
MLPTCHPSSAADALSRYGCRVSYLYELGYDQAASAQEGCLWHDTDALHAPRRPAAKRRVEVEQWSSVKTACLYSRVVFVCYSCSLLPEFCAMLREGEEEMEQRMCRELLDAVWDRLAFFPLCNQGVLCMGQESEFFVFLGVTVGALLIVFLVIAVESRAEGIVVEQGGHRTTGGPGLFRPGARWTAMIRKRVSPCSVLEEYWSYRSEVLTDNTMDERDPYP